MRKTILLLTLCFLVTLVSGPLLAQENIIYPAKGQSEEQMEKDKFECYTWARNQTGFDPMKAPTATEPPPQQESGGSTAGGAVKGGLLGAGAGAAIGAIAGDAGTGAAIGAIGGGLFGGARRRSQNQGDQRRQEQWEQEQVNNYARNRDGYNRAYRACLEGRGYSVQ